MKRRRWIAAGIAAGLLAVLFGAASVDRCGAWPAQGAALTLLAQGQGPLLVGAARVELALPFPLTVGGYPPPRSSAASAAAPLAARALVLEVGGQKLGLVLLEVLLIPPQLRDAIAHQQPFPTWVLATHSHSGPGGFDPRPAAQLAALGRWQPEVTQALVDAARAALAAAAAELKPARLEVGEGLTEGVSVARSGPAVDRRLTRLRFDGEAGPLAQLLIVSAHPTLVARRPGALHPDWPGLLAQRLERDGGPVTLVLQGAGGNASIDRQALPTAEAAADRLEQLVRALPTTPQAESLDAAWTEVRVALPRPDARNVVPGFLAPLAENLVCEQAEEVAVLHGLRLGEARLLLVPVEPSLAAGLLLEEQAGGSRLASLADGSLGYVETVQAARDGQGEARRQLFGPELLTRLAEGAKLAGGPLR